MESSAETLIKVDKSEQGIGFITINRPKYLNSLTKCMISDLAQAFKQLEGDNLIKVIIITGSGRAFCSGIDLTAAEDVFKGNVADKENDPVWQMEHCKKPIIGAINGFCVTAGFEIALACDILIVSTDAKFIDTHARFGIFPSWGLSQKLSRIMGPNRAREVSLTCMTVTAEMAEKWGLVNHVVEGSNLVMKAQEVAEAMIKNNQDMIVRIKSVLNDGYKLDLLSALSLEKTKAHKYYDGMCKEQFEEMKNFISTRRSRVSSRM